MKTRRQIKNMQTSMDVGHTHLNHFNRNNYFSPNQVAVTFNSFMREKTWLPPEFWNSMGQAILAVCLTSSNNIGPSRQACDHSTIPFEIDIITSCFQTEKHFSMCYCHYRPDNCLESKLVAYLVSSHADLCSSILHFPLDLV